MIRSRQIPINDYLLSMLRIVADQQQVDCVETLIEAWLRERLDTMPEIADLAKIRAEKRKEADAIWRAKYQPAPE